MNEEFVILGIDIEEENRFNSFIQDAISQAELELVKIDESIE